MQSYSKRELSWKQFGQGFDGLDMVAVQLLLKEKLGLSSYSAQKKGSLQREDNIIDGGLKYEGSDRDCDYNNKGAKYESSEDGYVEDQAKSERGNGSDSSYGSETSDDQSDDSSGESSESSGDEELDNSDGDDDTRACFPCPFCYVEIEVNVLCSHLQEEHCFDLKNAVCPLCAGNLGKDVIEHFMVQHASSLTRWKESQKSDASSSSPRLGKELSSFLGLSTNARGSSHESKPDLLPSTLPHLSPEAIKQDESTNRNACVTSDLKSPELPSLDEGHEQDSEERRRRAAFVEQLIESTFLWS